MSNPDTYIIVCTKREEKKKIFLKTNNKANSEIKCKNSYWYRMVDPAKLRELTDGRVAGLVDDVKELKKTLNDLGGLSAQVSTLNERINEFSSTGGSTVQPGGQSGSSSVEFKAEDYIGVFSSGFGIVISFFVLGLIGAVVTRFLRTDWFGR